MTCDRIAVAVVDDHPVLAEGVARAVAGQPDFNVVGVANSLDEAFRLFQQSIPDVVVMDYVLPDGDGVAASVEIQKRWPSVRVLMLSGIREEGLMARAKAAGCVGLLGKDGETSDLYCAIRSAASGGSVIGSTDLVGRRGGFTPGAPSSGMTLTAREYEVLRHLAKCTPVKIVAAELRLSVHTVRHHVQKIFDKIGAHSKLEAIAIVVRDRLLPIEAISCQQSESNLG